MLKVCRLNRAASYLNLGDMVGAVRDCSDVLRVDPINVKALFRRAKASSNMRTDILSVSNAKQDLHMASIIKPNDPQIEALKAQVEADLPQLEEKLLALHYRDKPFWTVGEQVMVTKKGRLKLGGRGSLHPGDIGVVRDVDEDLKAGGRVQVQNIKTGDSYWYDMEEICRAFQGEEDVEVEPAAASPAQPEAEAAATGPSPPSATAQQHHDDIQRLEQLRSDVRSKAAAAAAAAASSAVPASPSVAAPARLVGVTGAGPEEHVGRSETDEDAERDIDDILAAMQEELGCMGDAGRELLGPDSTAVEQRRDSPEETSVAAYPTDDAAMQKQS
eukprot:COSAG02_NODE_8081_length_2719_cov_7.817939_1_plen_331_part_00